MQSFLWASRIIRCITWCCWGSCMEPLKVFIHDGLKTRSFILGGLWLLKSAVSWENSSCCMFRMILKSSCSYSSAAIVSLNFALKRVQYAVILISFWKLEYWLIKSDVLVIANSLFIIGVAWISDSQFGPLHQSECPISSFGLISIDARSVGLFWDLACCQPHSVLLTLRILITLFAI